MIDLFTRYRVYEFYEFCFANLKEYKCSFETLAIVRNMDNPVLLSVR
jgi:hypothetical protein